MEFLDDLLSFGAGALDSVSEHAQWLFGGDEPTTSNPNLVQPQDYPVVDNNGNAVTTPQGSVPATKNNTMLYVGGAVAAILLILLITLLMKRK